MPLVSKSVHRALAALAVVTLIFALSPSIAAAHTELLQASPGPGQRAGGEIDFLDLVFLEPVNGTTVDVVHNGNPVPGETVVSDGSIIRFEFDEPLTSPGEYEVNYRLTSFDLDETDGSYRFTFDPDAPQARRIGELGETQGRNWVSIIATGVLIAALAGLAFLFLSRLERRRRYAADGDAEATPTEYESADHDEAER